MKAIKHIIENPFVAGAGVAALAHSTWSLGTLFSGLMPIVSGDDPMSFAMWVYWFVPAFLIAFAMDIGQIDTSRKIRHDGLTWQRGVTFFVFAIATYYLQFLYIAHHMPALQIETGVSDFHRWAVTELRNAGIWILPALLPLATLLYTLSDDKHAQKSDVQGNYQDTVTNDHKIAVTDINPIMAEWVVNPEDIHVSECPDCGWVSDEKTSQDSADRALRAHRLHCDAYANIERLKVRSE